MTKIILAHAYCAENGGINGERGDQLQKTTPDYKGELRISNFYVNKKGWNVLRPKDATLAEDIARLAVEAVNNPNIGYSQNDRDSLYACGSVRTKKKCNTDCSALVRQLVREASGKDIPNFNTEVEIEVLEKTGLFMPVFRYVENKTTLFTGDILTTCPIKGHTATVAKGEPLSNPYLEPTVTVTSNSIATKNGIKVYCPKGDPVRWVQYNLILAGFRTQIDACGGIDGICGSGTVAVIKKYQAMKNLEVDGIVGKNTRSALRLENIW